MFFPEVNDRWLEEERDRFANSRKRKLWERQLNQHESVEGERLWKPVRGHCWPKQS